MLVVGLTGGIASGKSMVAEEFAKLGIDIIDTDHLARQVVAPGEPALKSIAEHFGEDVLLPNGNLDRKRLRDLIFANPSERKWLENLLHPLIRQRANARIKQSTSAYCIVVIPLLVETKFNPLINRILVVDAEPELQQERLLLRDNMSPEQIRQILAAQAKREERLAKADDILHNNDSIETLKKQIHELHEHYLALAKQ